MKQKAVLSIPLKPVFIAGAIALCAILEAIVLIPTVLLIQLALATSDIPSKLAIASIALWALFGLVCLSIIMLSVIFGQMLLVIKTAWYLRYRHFFLRGKSKLLEPVRMVLA